MGTVVMHNVVSVDGFIADANDEVGPLFDWYGNGGVPLIEGGPFRSHRLTGARRRARLRSGSAVSRGALVDRRNGNMKILNGHAGWDTRPGVDAADPHLT
jgi:hypothetical protein